MSADSAAFKAADFDAALAAYCEAADIEHAPTSSRDLAAWIEEAVTRPDSAAMAAIAAANRLLVELATTDDDERRQWTANDPMAPYAPAHVGKNVAWYRAGAGNKMIEEGDLVAIGVLRIHFDWPPLPLDGWADQWNAVAAMSPELRDMLHPDAPADLAPVAEGEEPPWPPPPWFSRVAGKTTASPRPMSADAVHAAWRGAVEEAYKRNAAAAALARRTAGEGVEGSAAEDRRRAPAGDERPRRQPPQPRPRHRCRRGPAHGGGRGGRRAVRVERRPEDSALHLPAQGPIAERIVSDPHAGRHRDRRHADPRHRGTALGRRRAQPRPRRPVPAGPDRLRRGLHYGDQDRGGREATGRALRPRSRPPRLARRRRVRHLSVQTPRRRWDLVDVVSGGDSFRLGPPWWWTEMHRRGRRDPMLRFAYVGGLFRPPTKWAAVERTIAGIEHPLAFTSTARQGQARPAPPARWCLSTPEAPAGNTSCLGSFFSSSPASTWTNAPAPRVRPALGTTVGSKCSARLGTSFRRPADRPPAGDTVELVREQRGNRYKSACFVVRASAPLVRRLPECRRR